ncbi:MAG TPA: hypothetical protein VJZ72_10400 [Candidatus Limnocylindrales bacterium]|nr:hypothetical protein [Candidatus Limnocylindrales bacterium]
MPYSTWPVAWSLAVHVIRAVVSVIQSITTQQIASADPAVGVGALDGDGVGSELGLLSGSSPLDDGSGEDAAGVGTDASGVLPDAARSSPVRINMITTISTTRMAAATATPVL